jgi:hypothetical protein
MNSLPNNDGILYLKTAAHFNAAGFAAAVETYPWPFYAIAIAYIQQWTSFSLIHSAYLLNTILYAILMVGLLDLTQLLDKRKHTLMWAVLLMLIHPALNDYRPYIIRDTGYWTFLILATTCYIRYLKQAHLLPALLWALCLVLSLLFRIESLVFLVGMPWIVFGLPLTPQERWQRLIGLYALLLGTGILICFVLLALHQAPNTMPATRLGTVLPMISAFFSNTATLFTEKINIINTRIFTLPFNDHLAQAFFLISGMLGYLLYKLLFSTAGLLHGILMGFNALQTPEQLATHSETERTARGVVLYTGTLAALIVVLFFVSTYIFTSRYLMSAVLIWLPLAPITAVTLTQQLFNQTQRLPIWLTHRSITAIGIVVILATALSGIVSFGYSKTYVQQAGLWFQTLKVDPKLVYTNDPLLSFFALESPADIVIHPEIDISALLTHPEEYPYQYFLLKIRALDTKANDLLETQTTLNRLQSFKNARGDQIVILEKSKHMAEATPSTKNQEHAHEKVILLAYKA